MPEDILIRPYHSNDFNACVKCFESNVPTYFTIPEIKEFKDWLAVIDRPNLANTSKNFSDYFVLLAEKKIIGCGGFGLADNGTDIVFAWGMIHRSSHHQGYGKALAEYRLANIKNRFPLCNIVLDTTQHTYRFFEKLGFVIEKITPGFYAPGLHRYDMKLSAATKLINNRL